MIHFRYGKHNDYIREKIENNYKSRKNHIKVEKGAYQEIIDIPCTTKRPLNINLR